MMGTKRVIRKLFGESGQSMVEMALILPVLLLLLMGVMQFGLVMGSYLLMGNAAREGARLAAVGGTDSEIRARVSAVSGALDPDDLDITISPTGTRARGTSVTITLEYPVDIFLPLPAGVIPDPLPLETFTTMRVE
ncbi:MAG: pilus assembly protein [Firmicutes bacterium]|nr:pilus assembly protein [Bacillota bacterium]